MIVSSYKRGNPFMVVICVPQSKLEASVRGNTKPIGGDADPSRASTGLAFSPRTIAIT
jgi:hypothetical protein